MRGEESEKEARIVVVPYLAGLSEDIRTVCRGVGIRMVFWLSIIFSSGTSA